MPTPNAPGMPLDDMFSWFKDSVNPVVSGKFGGSPSNIMDDRMYLKTHVVGFMDYDPKQAARISRNNLKKKGRPTKWFEM
eukprot:CAMPEP_0182428936 /NCGR_PEP_ID=MMETSP1167-20130531/24747_1 /TAXON_ID=2988 /ORGANISM="Mallomonas Sp, Strain CCMP3275" /LENGTH=79 /DNA_ID=CAMNT_0024612167 /DNA_START=359 /DNA_END=598 /DNA_ORIENTATION=+